MGRRFDPRILAPAIRWLPVAGIVAVLVVLFRQWGPEDGVGLALGLVAYATLVGAPLGALTSIPVGLVVERATRGQPARVARARGATTAAVATLLAAAVWATVLHAWYPRSTAVLALGAAAAVAGVALGVAAGRLADSAPAEAVAHRG